MRDSVMVSAEPRAPGRPRRPRRPSRPRRQHRTPSTSPAPTPSPPAARGASPFLASAASGDKQRRGIRASEGEGEGRFLESQSSEPWPFNSKSLLEDKELLEAAAEEDEEEEEREEGQGGRAGPSVVQRLARTTRDPSIRMQCRVVASLQPFSSAATIFSEAGERSFALLQERVRAVAQAHRDQAPFLPAMGNERADELLGIRRSSQRRPRTPDHLSLAARRPPRRHHTTGRAGAGPGAEEAEEEGRASPQKPLEGGAGGGGGGRRRRRRRPSRVARLHDPNKEATSPGRLAGLGDWETSSPSPSPSPRSRARSKAKGKAKSPARAKGKGLGFLRPSASSECVRLQLVHRRHRHAPLAALR